MNLFRVAVIEGREVLQMNTFALAVDGSGAFCPGVGNKWVDVPRVEIPVEIVWFKSDPRDWNNEHVYQILQKPTAFAFWALWKRDHIVSDSFAAEVLKFAAAIDAAPVGHWIANDFVQLACKSFSFDVSLADARQFFERFLDVFKGERRVVYRVRPVQD